jgi:glycosyltransferase involved in cell wall biosynthesis
MTNQRMPLRVGIDVGPLAIRSGGIPRYVEELVRAFQRIACTTEFVLCGPIDRARLKATAPRMQQDRSGFPLEKLVKEVCAVGTGHLDLFHGTNYLPPLLVRAPTVLTVHDLTVQLFPETHGALRRLRHAFLPVMCRRASRIIADSHSTKHDLVEHYDLDAERIDVVHLAASDEFAPVRDEEQRERVRRRYDLPENFVLFVGCLDPRKRLDALIEAHAQLRREGCPFPLVLGGEGAPRHVAELCALAERHGLEPGKHLILTGHVANEDLPTLYSLCELFVYPSRYEGFGLPPLEAMACGAPVLVPDNSSFRELYQGTPMLFDLEHTESLTSAMRAALVSRDWRNRMIEEGQKRAALRTWTTVAAETLDCYRRAVSAA